MAGLLSDLVTTPFRWASALRGRRIFHPAGVIAGGVLERLAPPGRGLPINSCDVVARVSKGAGTPGVLPDVVGLAWKMPPSEYPPAGWDVLLASTGAGLLTRIGLRPVTSWSDVTMSSLMPLRYQQQLWWIRAKLITEIDDRGLTLDSIRNHIDDGGIVFAVQQAGPTGGFELLGQLTLNRLLASHEAQDLIFDPTINSASQVRLAPAWLTGLRRSAYDRSREGRDA
ncbi:phosphodiesterase [Mycobacterium shimoidei]|uniref:phosphodiesterase n=1 Tax=Mycobacterium shimoidei TaxID=29313 RepID=UPI0008484D59|nr:phosphodiesterase [Mycobacterium shimoidei]MCV7257943.1 phosphodiesterase [Mycobacterium shimoidei]ODR14116.1 phosphodiesterase [Mycobacterium shimoidei]ORW83988.1 phosphodiesterase [Mycobacterium shimoidei]